MRSECMGPWPLWQRFMAVMAVQGLVVFCRHDGDSQRYPHPARYMFTRRLPLRCCQTTKHEHGRVPCPSRLSQPRTLLMSPSADAPPGLTTACVPSSWEGEPWMGRRSARCATSSRMAAATVALASSPLVPLPYQDTSSQDTSLGT